MRKVHEDELFAVLSYGEYLVPLDKLGEVLKLIIPANVNWNNLREEYEVAHVRQFPRTINITRGASIIAAQARQRLEEGGDE